jgi:hypothetical protein
LPSPEEFTCRGLNYVVTLDEDSMILRSRGWVRSSSHELPVDRVKAVIVLRKSLVPYAAFTILAAIATLVTKFNSFWFLVNLSPDQEALLGNIAMLATALFAIPSVLRALFVEIVISWGGRPSPFLVRFVRAGQGRRLARMFDRLSSGI